ncbi:YggS family pyridoxal phosphate-dependent enzyme [Sulfurospirillum arcachonense]|uniref:YggS family pyridoxal phosphate-dependent enzyme n=1 Tax=Sulfurospirillum arcachonense TaxID=57666 RepID=UPI0004693E25|nr:YggS family pyridoxal phosphate-dependent enzyme [Sulfurospirillum arcachonense]
MSLYECKFDEVLTNIEKVRLRVNQHQIIKIIAVSKSVGSSEISNMYDIGQRAFGENRIQDLKSKVETLNKLPIEWHFIGRLQTNKINALIDLNPSLMHSCSSLKMAQEIDKRLEVKGKTMSVLLQINSAYEDQKAGVLPEDAIKVYDEILSTCKNIKLKGVMSIGAHSDDKALIRKSFKITHNIFTQLQTQGAKYCSMGMSSDYELAVECGSNMLRIGSTFFK